MADAPSQTQKTWLERIFEANSAQNGGVVRRSVADVNRFSSEAKLKEEATNRGFHLIQTGDQFVILCHPGKFKVIC